MGPKRIKYFTILPLKQTSSASKEKNRAFRPKIIYIQQWCLMHSKRRPPFTVLFCFCGLGLKNNDFNHLKKSAIA